MPIFDDDDNVGVLLSMSDLPERSMGDFFGVGDRGQALINAGYNSDGAAAWGQALQNISLMNMGFRPGPNPVAAANDVRAQNFRLMEAKRRGIEAAENRRSALAQRDPMYQFERFVESRGIGELPYQEQLAQYKDFYASVRPTRDTTPSNVREWEYFSNLSPENQAQYLEMKRATQFIDGPGGTTDRYVGGGQTAPVGATVEQMAAGDATVAGAVEAARQGEQREAEILASNETRARTLNTYDSAMTKVAEAFGVTSTGPLMGWLPAVTVNQRNAEGAVSAMTPILKSIFREAGEGVFTDKDQELLMGMMPTRKDQPETIAFKLQMVDEIVRAKLAPSGNGGTEQPKATKRFNRETGKIEAL